MNDLIYVQDISALSIVVGARRLCEMPQIGGTCLQVSLRLPSVHPEVNNTRLKIEGDVRRGKEPTKLPRIAAAQEDTSLTSCSLVLVPSTELNLTFVFERRMELKVGFGMNRIKAWTRFSVLLIGTRQAFSSKLLLLFFCLIVIRGFEFLSDQRAKYSPI